MGERPSNPVGDLMARVAHDLGAQGDREAVPAGGADDASDPLATALCDLARHYGSPLSVEAVLSGLPLVDGRLALEHLDEAAERAGLRVRRLAGRVCDAREPDFPLLVVSAQGEATIAWSAVIGADAQGSGVREELVLVSAPGHFDQRVRIPVSEFSGEPGARVFCLTPGRVLDARGAKALETRPRSWFFQAFRQSRAIYAQAIAATLAVNILALAMPLFSMNVYDRVLPNAAEATLWALAIGVILAIAFDFLIRGLRSHFVDAASRVADVRLSTFIYGRLLGAKMSASPTSAGVRANTIREFETLREFFNSATLTAFGDLPFLMLFLLVLWVIAGPLVWVVAVAIPVILAMGWLTQRSLARLIESSFKEAAQKNAVVVEAIVGMESIKAAGAESWAAQRWETSSAEHVRTGLAIRHITNLGQHSIQAVQTLVQLLVVVVGFYLVQAGDMTMGALIAATILSGRALAPLAQAASLLSRFNQARIAYRTLSEVVNAAQERESGASYLTRSNIAGRIAFEAVTHAYQEEGQPALKEVSLDITAGERVAFLGRIGSGKTTALKLMQAIHGPTGGRVLLDQIAVSQYEPAVLRAQVGLLLQGPELFHGTVRENIAIGWPSAPDEAVMRAAATAGAMEWISRLPQGFDTQLFERGAGLSGGQRQTLALARTLLRQPQVLLLDEPTSDMDQGLERLVLQRLKGFLGERRTLVVVTHRLAPLDLVDRIVVFEGGQIVEDGPKAEVLGKLTGKTPGAGAAVSGTAQVNEGRKVRFDARKVAEEVRKATGETEGGGQRRVRPREGERNEAQRSGSCGKLVWRGGGSRSGGKG